MRPCEVSNVLRTPSRRACHILEYASGRDSAYQQPECHTRWCCTTRGSRHGHNFMCIRGVKHTCFALPVSPHARRLAHGLRPELFAGCTRASDDKHSTDRRYLVFHGQPRVSYGRNRTGQSMYLFYSTRHPYLIRIPGLVYR